MLGFALTSIQTLALEVPNKRHVLVKTVPSFIRTEISQIIALEIILFP
jgi:hypothetical protein